MKRQIDSIAVRGGGHVELFDVSTEPDVACEIHDMTPAELMPIAAFFERMRRSPGLTACAECLERFCAYAKAHR